MKTVLQFCAGFIVYAIAGTVEAGLVLMALLPGNLYDGYALLFLAPPAGLCCGLVGIAATHLIRSGAYRAMANVSIATFVVVACTMPALLAL